jgi:hypothetical protein
MAKYDKLIIEVQKDGAALASVAFVMDELRFLEEMRDIPLKEHVYNMVDVLMQTLDAAPAAPGPTHGV